mmetsp:Transcript_28504/g.69505  ORF Transcript_28504/g.69505 Transcript_28504/m.69505 type:complete len:86 (-) Transcript_28504:140-397(-)|eukprot:CAMPEP_0114511086 /NCGR_PEP_ID=MMETSP0109-20121206/14158_1 /TAXON_ID=29199 /ORGANISM="Chlorarachnion reptans, Strain CCCM449" /LENGTH=85 /DNA_ID=CAMNT_0001690487 /DNA_START=347 /DNA_END=604 /DNA_ORIENTATION=-
MTDETALNVILIIIVTLVCLAMGYSAFLIIKYMYFSSTRSRSAQQPEIPDEHRYRQNVLRDPTSDEVGHENIDDKENGAMSEGEG